MYSRSYFTGGSEISLPENYDGTAFSEDSIQDEIRIPKIESAKNEIKFSPKTEEKECDTSFQPPEYDECMTKEKGTRGGIFGIDFKGILGSVFSGDGFSSILPKDFGIEEIIIIGIALFLLFSPERDIECSLMLLALIFIK